MSNKTRLSAEVITEIRALYTPEVPKPCPTCGSILIIGSINSVETHWLCPNATGSNQHYLESKCITRNGDRRVLELIGAYEKLALPEVEAFALERHRQINEEGWTPEHDDKHIRGELAKAALCYLMTPFNSTGASLWWPWDRRGFKDSPDNRKRELEKAGALAMGEWLRFHRLEREVQVFGSSENLPVEDVEYQRGYNSGWEDAEEEFKDSIRQSDERWQMTQRELTTLRSIPAPRWVKVGERLPEPVDGSYCACFKKYFFKSRDGGMYSGVYCGECFPSGPRWLSEGKPVYDVIEWLEEPAQPLTSLPADEEGEVNDGKPI